MRAKLKQWLKLLSVAGPLGGCCLTSPCQGCSSAVAQEPVKPASASVPTPPKDGTVAATVNGEVIRLDRVDSIVRYKLKLGGPLTQSQVKALRQDIVDALIDDALFNQFLVKNSRKVEPEEIEQHLAGLKEALRRQNKLLADFCRETGQGEADIRNGIVSMLQFNHYVDQRTTPEELKKHHEAYIDYFNSVQVKLSHIVIRVSPNAPPGERTAAHEKLVKIRAEIVDGKLTFAEAAKKYSVCASAAKGGDLGFITRRASLVDEPVAELAFSLQVNHMGGPIASDEGLHLICVTDRTKGTPQPLEKVLDWVKESYSEELRQRIVKDLRKHSTITMNLPD